MSRSFEPGHPGSGSQLRLVAQMQRPAPRPGVPVPSKREGAS